MKARLTCGLALAAAVAIAVVGAAGSAAAYQVVPVTVTDAAHGHGTRMFVVEDCALDPQSYRKPRFEVLVNVDHNGAGSQGQDNVNWVQVIALDEDNYEPWDFELAEVEAMRIEYLGYTDRTKFSKIVQTRARDGVHTFRAGRANVDRIEIRVRWDTFVSDEDRVLQCNLDLPDTFSRPLASPR